MKYKKGVTIVNTWKILYKYSKIYIYNTQYLSPFKRHCIDLKFAELLRWPKMNVYPSAGFEQCCDDVTCNKEV